LVQEEEEAGYT